MTGRAWKQSTADRLLPFLRAPGKLGRLRQVQIAGNLPGQEPVQAILIDDEAHRYYPVISGVPRLLPFSNALMAASLRELITLDAAAGFQLPPFNASGSEVEHYEMNGIRDVTTGEYDNHRIKICCDLVPPDTMQLLDIGAGPGTFLTHFTRSRSDIFAFGIERSSAAVAAAPSEVAMIQGVADALPLADGCVDCCVSMETLEHLPDPVHGAALREMARISSRYVLVNVPYRERRLQTRCQRCDCVFNPNYHMRSYDDALLDSLLPGYFVRKKIILPRSESILKAIVAPFRRHVFSQLDYAICPQCGMGGADQQPASDEYRTGSHVSGHMQSGDNTIKSALKAVSTYLPNIAVRGEIIVLYERQ